MSTRETLKFHFDAWLSRKGKDGQLMRELPATRPQRDSLPSMIHNDIVKDLRSEEKDKDRDLRLEEKDMDKD